MIKFLKILMIFAAIILVVLSSIILWEELPRQFGRDYEYGYDGFDYALLFPIGLILFGLPSIIYNLKSFKANDLQKTFLIVSNLIFGIIVTLIGVVSLYRVLTAFPLSSLPRGLDRYAFVLAFLSSGLVLCLTTKFKNKFSTPE
ncbi:hypothetical protein BH10BAC1_BH10BAC1_19450 [soil metagenome]